MAHVEDNEIERSAQVAYWTDHSQAPTVETMMLDTQAKALDALDRPEVRKTVVRIPTTRLCSQILSALGSVENKTVLEIGAGMGRLSGELAKSASKLIACDFMEHLTKENEKHHGHLGNIEFITDDATKLKMEKESVDVIFSNWLLMYLSDEEIEKFTKKALGWLREGGTFFFRESCYRSSGDMKREANPTHYRDVLFYFSILDKIFLASENGKYYKFKLAECANLASYVKIKRNYGQIYWKFTKVEKDEEHVEFRHFLDHVQYTKNGILRYEKLFGRGFISSGGSITMDEIVRKLNLQPGQLLLDVGCGIGGACFHLAERFDVDVLGIDLSVNMVAIALERACTGQYTSTKGCVKFKVADCTKNDFERDSIDIIYSRDAILHIQDKPDLFKRMFTWLKPGGKLLITDYCRSVNDPTPGFAAYIKQRGYDLHPVPAYGQMLMDTGFAEVSAEDATESKFLASLERELKTAEEQRESFLNEFSEEDYIAVVKGWKEKIARVHAGEQRWGIFYGKKPT